MNLNHYTSILQFQIISKTALRTGHYFAENGSIYPAIWFTTSENAEGHGLPDGSEFSEVELGIIKGRGEIPKNNFSTNKRSVKIIVDGSELKKFNKKRPEAGGLISFLEFSKFLNESPEYRRKLAVRGFHTNLPEVSNAEILRLSAGLKTKEKTWYVYLSGDIPVSKILAVQGFANGLYTSFDFDLHARPALIESGFFPVSQNIYKEMDDFWGRQPYLQYPVAACICRDPADIPSVSFLNHTFGWKISINNPEVISETISRVPPNVSDYIKVVERHHSELMQLWEEAVESYYTFHPERRPSLISEK